MSSMRNAVPRRPHRERAQPHARARHGLLEKHKDYSQRAADYNLKKRKLRALRQKAIDRNPDEFHFGMITSRTKDGVKVASRGNVPLSMDVVKLLKTQDAGYLRIMAGKFGKEKERLLQEMQFVEGSEGNVDVQSLKQLDMSKDNDSDEDDGDDDRTENVRHTVFVEDGAQDTFDAGNWFGTDEAGLKRGYNRPRRHFADYEAEDETEEDLKTRNSGVSKRLRSEQEKLEWKAMRAAQKKRKAQQERQKGRLKEVERKERELLRAAEILELQRAKMNNNVDGVNKNGVKFKVRERKR